ncbi:hypothetical protein OIU34_22600 [Pararhizobium sp. BT-229]|uniref:hypothetical protein n=1 Tax=Pararhizobium sp. BT-229 TaxID=2986923 RepID=UPI0021F70132|nr:hypothetical protein [Pararhizobium sp. BT-229]MCV9964684.1 hypothetical protein [Pararhizobium sp. BT-229]
MTPNEIYALPSTDQRDWRSLGREGVERVFGVSGFSYNAFDGRYPVEDAKIVVSDKLYYYEDHDRGTSIKSVSIDGKPFAILMSAGEDGDAGEDCMVTDEELFKVAQRHVLDHLVEHILGKEHGHDVRDPAKYDFPGYVNAMFVRVGDEVRFVDPRHCRRTDGRLIFDDVAMNRKFDELLRPQIDVVRTQGLADEARRLNAIEVLRAAVPSDLKVVEIDRRNDRGDWIALAYTDGVDTMTLVASKREFSTFYWLDISPMQVGPSSVLTAIESHVAGLPIDAAGPAAADIAQMFGCTPLEAVQALDNWGGDMSSDLCSEILNVIGAPSPVDAQEGPLDRWKVHAYVAEHPEAVVYCRGGYPSVKQAKEIMAGVNERRTRDAQRAAAKKV